MILKITITIAFVLFRVSIAFSQDKISVLVKGPDMYIETYDKTFNDDFSLFQAYRLGPGAAAILKQGIKKALEWSELNETHQKDFEKEICRFKVMKKEQYKSMGYVDFFSSEMSVQFKGLEDGSFKLTIKEYDNSYTFIELTEREMVKKFNALLSGKSVNKEIDEIFN